MTVSSNVSKATYDGDGSTTVFAVPFLFNAKADVSVTHADAAGAETIWVENTQYTLAGVGNPAGGTLTVKTTPTDYTPATGERLTIKRVVAQTQETDYPEGGEFPAKAHEDALDKLTFQVHDLQEQIGRNLTAPATDQSPSLEIPNETLRASKFLAFDGSGNPVAAAGTSADLTPVSAFMNTLLDDGDAVTARGTLGAQAGLEVPSQAEAEAGAATTERVWTAERVGQAIAAQVPKDAIVAGARNLVGQPNAANPNFQVDIDADEIVLKDASRVPFLASAVDLTADITASGANGLDTGSEAGSTWYFKWVIYNGTTVAALLSASATTPTLPSGYTFKALVGAVYNDSGSNFDAYHQRGRRVAREHTQIFNDQAGVTSFTTQSISALVPSIARTVSGNMGRSTAGDNILGIGVASDAAGLGGQYAVLRGHLSASFAGFETAAPFVDLVLKTAQSLFWIASDTTSVYRLSASGWSF